MAFTGTVPVLRALVPIGSLIVANLCFNLNVLIILCHGMLWHFGRGGYCNKCEYWDNVYLEHLANVDSSNDVVMQEISDADMLEAAMEIDGSSE